MKQQLIIPIVLAVVLAGCVTTDKIARKGCDTYDKAAANYLQEPEKVKGWLKDDYYVRNWLALGPYKYDENKYGGEDGGQEANDIAFVKNEAKLTPKNGAKVGNMKWQKMKSAARVDLDALYNGIEFAGAYVGAYLHSPKEMKEAILYIGSDDYVKVYINGKLVHTYNDERRAAERDEDKVTGITLKKGWNRVVIKVVDVVYDWETFLRFADSKNRAMKVSSTK